MMREQNRSGEMEVFVRVAEAGGFSAAARSLGLTPSAVSKLVSRLEARLGARLVTRSTRRLQLTPEGEAFRDRATQILSNIDEAEREAAAGAQPRGHLRINSNIPFGTRHIVPVVASFLEAHPEVTIDLILSDTVVDLLDERADIAIRIGPIGNPSLISRKIGTSRMSLVASPEYLARHGTPDSPDALGAHRRIGWSFARIGGGWPFLREDGAIERIEPPVAARASDGDVARLLALSGVGLARLALFHIGPDIAEGRLVPVLEGFNPGDTEDIRVVYLGQSGPLPARVRAFIDMLVDRVRVPDHRLIEGPPGEWRVTGARTGTL